MAGSDDKYVKPMVFPSELARRGRGEDERATPIPESGEDSQITLHVLKSGPDAARESVAFRQSSVTVGRSRSCDLCLDDPKHVISGRHAEISLRHGKAYVTDLESRNFTYLDGQRLEPSIAYEIPPGSSVSVGEFAIQAEGSNRVPAPTEAPTVFEDAYQNPFTEQASRLADALGRIEEIYAAEAPGRRDKALTEAVEEALGEVEANESRKILGL